MGLLVWGLSVTRVHPGAGRSPGVVDLPVVRDPVGYPFVPGSEVKGSLKSFLLRKNNDDKNKSKVYCLLGREPNMSELEGASALAVADLYPLFLPAPSASRGLLYVTTPYLLARASELASAYGDSGVAGILAGLAGSVGESGPVLVGSGSPGELWIGGVRLQDVRMASSPDNFNLLNSIIRELGEPYKTLQLPGRLLIVPEDIGLILVNQLLLHLTRTKIDRVKKTVATGGLWTEEYIPWGTIFLGGIVDTGFRNNACKSNCKEDCITELERLLPSNSSSNFRCFHLVLGGKESIGSGLVKLCTGQAGNNN